jgi:hypothetical protein
MGKKEIRTSFNNFFFLMEQATICFQCSFDSSMHKINETNFS